MQTKNKYKPVVHFTPPANWMNDPNGMVYVNGRYHLFYQYYPAAPNWGPMHWAMRFLRICSIGSTFPLPSTPMNSDVFFQAPACLTGRMFPAWEVLKTHL